MKKLLTLCTIFCAVLISSCDTKQDPPVLTILTSNGQLIVEAAGGPCSFEYAIINPAEDGEFSIEVPEDATSWITDLEVDEEDWTVNFNVTENVVKETRNALLIVRYRYGEESVTAPVSVLQNECGYDYIMDATVGGVTYYANTISQNGAILYYLTLGNGDHTYSTPNEFYYNIDLFLSSTTEDLLPLPGTYTLCEFGEESDFNFTSQYTYAEHLGEDVVEFSEYVEFGFEDGTVEVEREGNIFTIKAALTDTEGAVHYVVYEGELSVTDMTDLSSLEGDFEIDLTDKAAIRAMNYGDYYGIDGFINWYFVITDINMNTGGAYYIIDAMTPADLTTLSGSLVFEAYDGTEQDYYYIPGGMGGSYTWYQSIETYDPANNFLTLGEPSFAVIDGTITIEVNADGTTANISSAAFDAEGNAVNVHGTNLPISFEDQSQSASVMGLPVNKAERPAKSQSIKRSLLK